MGLRLRIAAGVAAVALAACQGEATPRTQVMAIVDAEQALPPGTLGIVDVTIRAGGEEEPPTSWETVYEARFDPRDLPVEIAILPRDGDPSRRFEVRAEANNRPLGEELVTSVQSGFLPRRTLQLGVLLRSTCLARTGGCNELAPPETLPDYAPDDPDGNVADAGPEASRRDAGGEDPRPRDAGPSGDTEDAGADAGPPLECEDASDCPPSDDPCLKADCPDGRCATTPDPGNDCDDGNACTEADRCDDAGVCRGGPVSCGDKERCVDAGGRPSCECIDGTIRCSGVCQDVACCPGAEGGDCEACGTKRCRTDGSGFDCVPPSPPPDCTNPGGVVCFGGGAGCDCPLGQRKECDAECRVSGCF
jgi:hypothetical protein